MTEFDLPGLYLLTSHNRLQYKGNNEITLQLISWRPLHPDLNLMQLLNNLSTTCFQKTKQKKTKQKQTNKQTKENKNLHQ